MLSSFGVDLSGGTAVGVTSIVAAAAGGFDVDAATRAYMNMVQGPARARSDAYFDGGYGLLWWGTLLFVAVNWALLHFGWSARWSAWATRAGKRRWLQPALYWVPYLLTTTLILLPWTLYEGFYRERSYGLMNLTLAGWLGEQGISLAISLVAGALVLAGLFALIRRARRTWWLWGTGMVTLLLSFAVLLSPVFIAPLFNHYTPMQAGPLRDQILAMAHANRIPTDNVWVFDASRQTDRISANVSGLGPTIRISLNDNLLKRVAPEGVKAVMGHEMGHYVLNHILELILSFAAVFLFLFLLLWWLTPRVLARFGRRWGVRDPGDPAALPVYAALASVIMLLLTPVLNNIVRLNEVEADAFGLDASREPDGMASVDMMLGEYRKLEPGRLEELIFFDHPSGYNRVRMAMEWKARHWDELPPEKRVMATPALLPPKLPSKE
jgi:STE24 endopeptidase